MVWSNFNLLCSWCNSLSSNTSRNVSLTHFSSVLHFWWKPVIWFGLFWLQIKWMVSIYNATLSNTKLKWIKYSTVVSIWLLLSALWKGGWNKRSWGVRNSSKLNKGEGKRVENYLKFDSRGGDTTKIEP